MKPGSYHTDTPAQDIGAPPGYVGILIRALDDAKGPAQAESRSANRDRSADVAAARTAMTIAKQLAKSDRLASLLFAAWRPTEEVFSFPAIDAYRQVASDFGYCLSTLVVKEGQEFAHLLFLCTEPGMTGPMLMGSLPEPWHIERPS